MVEFRQGDILKTDAEALVNTVNCVGIMGRGVALQFKNAFPENFKAYETACSLGLVQPGRMFVHETRAVTNPKYIINFPTKRHWRGASRLSDIDSGLLALAEEVRKRNIRSIAIPPLGSGLGGLNWADVRALIKDRLSSLAEVSITVFEPRTSPEATPFKNKKVPTMTVGRAALVGLVRRYLEGLLDPFVSLLEVHKLMYFMQASGEPLRLTYVEGPYGPYAENLRHVLSAVEGHLISGYADGGDSPVKQLELVPGATEEAETFLANHPKSRERFDRVADLVEGFETPFGLELLATTHWVMTNGGPMTDEEVTAKVYSWSDRKKQFSSRQIALAKRTLMDKSWL